MICFVVNMLSVRVRVGVFVRGFYEHACYGLRTNDDASFQPAKLVSEPLSSLALPPDRNP